MLAICLRSNHEFISSELKKIRDFYVHLRVFGRHTPDIVVRPEGTIDFGVYYTSNKPPLFQGQTKSITIFDKIEED